MLGLLGGLPAGEVVSVSFGVAFLEGELGAVVPFCGGAIGLLTLPFGALLGRDCLGHGLAHRDEVALHIEHGLLKHFFGVFSTIDEVIDIGKPFIRLIASSAA